MGWLLGAVGVYVFCYLIADKERLRIEREKLSRDWRVKAFGIGVSVSILILFLI